MKINSSILNLRAVVRYVLLIPFALAVSLPVQAVSQKTAADRFSQIRTDHWQPGQVRFDTHRWVEVIVGDLPLVISVPHGGLVHAEQIADRDCNDVGRVVRGVDRHTMETARAIEAVFLREYGKRPTFVIAHLSRRKVDQNREIRLATCGDPVGEAAWHYYHASIDSALAYTVGQFGHSALIDLHGHGHENQRLELGIMLNPEQLQDAYKGRHIEALTKRSSLHNYLAHHPAATFRDVVFGKHAFGSLLYRHGVPGTPARQDPHPVKGEKFFSGGYITERYTSPEYPTVYGWQIECHYRGIRDTDANREAFATALGKAYFGFVKQFPFQLQQVQ